MTVRVLLENRTGLGDGQTGPLEPVPLSNEARSIVQLTPTSVSEEHQLSFQVVPEQLGDLKLAVEAIPLPGEARQTNNRIETIIRVRRGGIRVALFDVVRSEQKWLRQINDSSRIQLDFHPIRSGAFRAQNRIPDRFFQPGSYDAYVIGDVPASAFSPEQLLAMTACCKQGAGLMMIGAPGISALVVTHSRHCPSCCRSNSPPKTLSSQAPRKCSRPATDWHTSSCRSLRLTRTADAGNNSRH
ncbi:MAG UNVERIFIED_CONTAM: hypothetical protein LVR18_44475 [Planctomycetaceae bacterium]